MKLDIINEQDEVAGAIYGFAYGDAWGRETEFMTAEQAILLHPQFPDHAYVSDDTQMHLYVLEGLSKARSLGYDLSALHHNSDEREDVSVVFAESFVRWLEDEDNNELRAPGKTCLDAVKAYRDARDQDAFALGDEGSVKGSKGCGTVMRAGWLGLSRLPRAAVINLALLQSEVTHGHPLASASAVATAVFTQELFEGRMSISNSGAITEGLDLLLELYRDATPDQAGGWSYNYRAGLAELINHYQDAIPAYLQWLQVGGDVSEAIGEGWVAEEAFVTAYFAACATFASRPYAALASLVWTKGDSDSIAAIGGMFYGIHYGMRAFPPAWRERLEPRYLNELDLAILELL